MLHRRFLLVIRFKYRSVYMSIPKSLTIPPLMLQPEVCFLSLSVLYVSSFVSFLFRFHMKGCHSVFLLLCLTYLTWYDALWVHPCCFRWHYFILFNGRVIVHCICVPHLLYPFLCRWAFRLLPCLGFCKQRYNEYWGACFSFGSQFSLDPCP